MLTTSGLEAIVRSIDLKAFPIPLQITVGYDYGDYLVIYISASVNDIEGGDRISVSLSRRVPITFSEAQVINLIRNAGVSVAVHEFLESMLVNGERIFDPHNTQYAVDLLQYDMRKVRPDEVLEMGYVPV